MTGPKRILLVDDDEGFNFLNRIILNSVIDDCSVSEALNGNAALEILSKWEECPEVILLDINMPIMNGWDFLQSYVPIYATRLPMTRIIILSSTIDPEDFALARQYPVVIKFISKPLSVENLEELKASDYFKQYFE